VLAQSSHFPHQLVSLDDASAESFCNGVADLNFIAVRCCTVEKSVSCARSVGAWHMSHGRMHGTHAMHAYSNAMSMNSRYPAHAVLAHGMQVVHGATQSCMQDDQGHDWLHCIQVF
jgi:hypothetical protein